jgi:uncharacterized protein
MATNDKIQILFDLGEVNRSRDWLDYLQYGFDHSDVSALLELVADDALNHANVESKEAWVPLHAWRTLGQIGSDTAIAPLIALFDQLVEDDWAQDELPEVMGMIGQSAIVPLSIYLNESHHDEFARAAAVDALAEIVKRDPSCRDQVIQCYQDYMSHPDESAVTLNGLLVCCLLDIDAKETINDIRQLFEKGCVDITCAGDLEEVEIELGFRTERATPKPDFAQLFGLDDLPELPIPDSDDPLGLIDYFLMHYGSDDSILDVSELDGFFTALACAPDTVMPSRWMPAIWGGEALAPEWETEKEFEEFSQAVFALYNIVMQNMNEHQFEPLYLVNEIEDKTYYIVDEWCTGFLRGVSLWSPLDSNETAFTEECLQSIRFFASDADIEQLVSMNDDEVSAKQDLIEADVLRLFQHFFEQRKPARQSVVRDQPKVGRNDPCPCGSGKKFKKCCLH